MTIANGMEDYTSTWRCPICDDVFWTKRGCALHALSCGPKAADSGTGGGS